LLMVNYQLSMKIMCNTCLFLLALRINRNFLQQLPSLTIDN